MTGITGSKATIWEIVTLSLLSTFPLTMAVEKLLVSSFSSMICEA